MSIKTTPDQLVASIICELDAARQRLNQAPAWIKNGETTMSAAALAEQIRLLCQEASSLSDRQAAHELLPRIRKLLQDLEIVLGTH